ncbi:hypothetical protein FRC02_006495 [Tulasnella sp. 418]|nr:hypothetical protein FRC02_006495 [Tulasnella sp. 418]
MSGTQETSPQGCPALTTPIRSMKKSSAKKASKKTPVKKNLEAEEKGPVRFSEPQGQKPSKSSTQSKTRVSKRSAKASNPQKSEPSPTSQATSRKKGHQTSKPPTYPLRDPIGTNHEGNREEELMFLSNNYRHWMEPGHTLTAGDLRGLVDMLDSVSSSLGLAVLFIVTAASHATELKALNWSVAPGSDGEIDDLVSF